MARSSKKGPFIAESLLKKVQRVQASGKREVIKTWSRSSMVTPDFVGMTFAIHDGKRFIQIYITENMVGHRLGEFAPTRTFRLHSGQRKAGTTTPEAPKKVNQSPHYTVTITQGQRTPSRLGLMGFTISKIARYAHDPTHMSCYYPAFFSNLLVRGISLLNISLCAQSLKAFLVSLV